MIDEDALHVWVDGAEVPSVTDGERAWGYARDQVAVCFEEDHLPPPGTQVEIEYPVSGCDPWDPY